MPEMILVVPSKKVSPTEWRAAVIVDGKFQDAIAGSDMALSTIFATTIEPVIAQEYNVGDEVVVTVAIHKKGQ